MAEPEPLVLSPDAAGRWAGSIGRALRALRLNRQFPDWERVRDHLVAAAARGLRIDRTSGLPVPREWARARIEGQLAGEGGGWIEPRSLHVALRHVEGNRASYAVRVDRIDLVTATLARYSLIVTDTPGRVVSLGELALQAERQFARRLGLLSTQDAALAFAVLRDQEGMEVEEVVRGVIGPAALPRDWCGPDCLRDVGLTAPVVSACLERASLDVEVRRVDDPLAADVVLPGDRQPFGLARVRKWAAVHADLPALRAWLSAKGSRGLAYGYAA